MSSQKNIFLSASRSLRFFVILFLLLTAPAYCQLSKIDSLKKILLTAKEDTNKVNALNALAIQFISSEPQKAYEYAQKALKLAEQIKWEKGIAKSEHSVGYYYFTQADYANTLEHYLRALKKNEKLSDKTGIAKSLGNIGLVYAAQSDYPKALDYYFKALKMAEDLGDKNLIAILLGNIGIVYSERADYPKALNYYFKALKMKEELGNKNGIANTLGNIGAVYAAQSDYPKALDYYFKALKMAEELGNKNNIAVWLGNIGIVYWHQADYPKVHPVERDSLLNRALDYYFKALKIKEELGNKNEIAITLGNIGGVYGSQADCLKASPTERNQSFGRALDYYFKALKMAEELGDKNGIARHLGNIGSLYTSTGKFAEAEKYLKHSLALYDSIGGLDGTSDFEKSLSQLYDTTGRTKLAFAHYKKYIAAKDSITNDENTKKQTRMAMQYEFDKKQMADSVRSAEILKQENLKHEQQIKQQKIYTYGGAIGFALMLVVAGVSFRAYRNKQKANEIISHQKKLVEEKQKEILDSIYYARRIQRSLLPTEKYIDKKLNRLGKSGE